MGNVPDGSAPASKQDRTWSGLRADVEVSSTVKFFSRWKRTGEMRFISFSTESLHISAYIYIYTRLN